MLQIDAHDSLSRFAVIERIGGLSFQTSPSPAPPSLYPLPLSLPYYLPLSCCRWALGAGRWGLGAGGWWLVVRVRVQVQLGERPGPRPSRSRNYSQSRGARRPRPGCSVQRARSAGLRASGSAVHVVPVMERGRRRSTENRSSFGAPALKAQIGASCFLALSRRLLPPLVASGGEGNCETKNPA
jgi:hypothetical protein